MTRYANSSSLHYVITRWTLIIDNGATDRIREPAQSSDPLLRASDLWLAYLLQSVNAAGADTGNPATARSKKHRTSEPRANTKLTSGPPGPPRRNMDNL